MNSDEDPFFYDQSSDKPRPSAVDEIFQVPTSRLRRPVPAPLLNQKKKGSNSGNQDQSIMESDLRYEEEESEEDEEASSERLSLATRNRLERLIRNSSSDLNNWANRKEKIEKIADQLLLTPELVRYHVNKILNRSSSTYKKTELFDDAIRQVITETPLNCIMTLKGLIQDRFGLDLAKQTLIRRVKNMGYKYQKFVVKRYKQPKATRRQLPTQQKIQTQMTAFTKSFNDLKRMNAQIVYYGTTHIALEECRGHMWIKFSEDGQKEDYVLSEQNVVHINIVLSRNTIDFKTINDGFYGNQSFKKTLTKWIDLLNGQQGRSRDPRPLFLVVEASAVHVLDIKFNQYLNDNGIMVFPFPEYAWQYNPAERLFNQIKFVTINHNKGRSIQQLKSTIESTINTEINAQDLNFAFQTVQAERVESTKKQQPTYEEEI